MAPHALRPDLDHVKSAPRFWGPNRSNLSPPVLRPNRSNPLARTTWLTLRFWGQIGQTADVDVCPTSRRALMPSSRSRTPAARAAYLTRHRPRRLGRRRLHYHVLLFFRAPCGPPMTPPGLIGSLGPSLLAFILHRIGLSAWTFRFTEPTRVHPSPRSFSMNLTLDLYLAPSTAMPHPTIAHHEPRDTSNPHDVVNHSSSKGDHHWSLISPLMSALTTPSTNSSYEKN